MTARLCLMFLLSLMAVVSSASAQPVIDARASAKIAAEGRASLLLSLREQADTTAIAERSRGEARLHAVVAALRAQAETSQAGLREWLDRRGLGYRAFWVANFLVVDADAALLGELAERAEIARIDLDVALRMVAPAAEGEAPGPLRAVEPGVDRVNAPALWAMGYTGQGVLVAGQDTGYAWNHVALRNQYAGWNGSSASHAYHWFDPIASGGGSCGPSSPVPCDDHGHGTHTMGTIVGDDGQGNQIGVAPGARWIGCRNMNVGDGTPSSYSACFQFFLAPTDLAGQNPDPARAPHVINNSWGCPPVEGCDTPGILQTVVDNVRNAGILVVASAGNAGSSCSTVRDPPAIYASSFVVGSITHGLAMSGFSSRGPVTIDGSNRLKPDIVAPGSSIRSSLRAGGYGNMSGTSMAGPHVAGVAALLMSVDPSLKRDPARVEALLKASAVNDVSNSQTCGGIPAATLPNPVVGHGRVDALSALLNGLGLLWRNGFE